MGFQLVKTLVSPLFGIFLVLVLGYLLGRIKIKGVSLGSAGVFIMAIVVGIVVTFIKDPLNDALASAFHNDAGVALVSLSWGSSTFSIVKNIGLALFVTAVGLIAGPKFFRNFKSKAVAYIVLGVVIIFTGSVVCILVALLDPNVDAATATGLLMGSLTSTPGFSAAQNVFDDQASVVAAANGAAYPFGVLGVVLFVQLLPKILRADMNKERQLMIEQGAPKGADIDEADSGDDKGKKLFAFDKFGLCIFAITVLLGLLIGSISFKFSESIVFNLTSTGGCLLAGLLFGHFGKIGKVSLKVPDNTLKVFRELGLVLFLMGSGFEGGLAFLDLVSKTPIVFLYGVLMTLIPMIVGFIVAKFIFKLCLLNNLGSITGGMTSTPALGSLIAVAESEDVASAYAATYPIALILLVFVPQLINLLGV
ncbi:MAG: permease [Clostridiales bacterium]|nr:permease [Clostridiales bacterium]